MRREIKPVGCHVESLDITAFLSDPVGWFQNYPSIDDTVWFLAHADDGVIWGRIRNGQLVISSNIFPDISPSLRTETLQQARFLESKQRYGCGEMDIIFKHAAFRITMMRMLRPSMRNIFFGEHELKHAKMVLPSLLKVAKDYVTRYQLIWPIITLAQINRSTHYALVSVIISPMIGKGKLTSN